MLTSIAQILSTTGDRLLILAFLGTSDTGIYSLGRSITQILVITGGVVGPVLYPLLTEHYGKTKDVASLRQFIKVPTVALGAVLPLIMGYVYFSIPVLFHWLLPAYESGISSAQILFWGVAIYQVSGVSIYLLVALNRQVLSFVLYSGGVCLGLALEYLALNIGMSLLGVAIGSAVSNVVYTMVLVFLSLRFCKFDMKTQIRTTVFAVSPMFVLLVCCIFLDKIFVSSVGSGVWRDIVMFILKGTLVSIIVLPYSFLILKINK